MARTGTGIHYEVSSGSGPPVLFIHGVTLDSRLWKAQVAEFGIRWRCITVDLRGHGESAAMRHGYDPTADLLEVLAAAVSGPAVVVGLSLGGFEAVILAALHPERCRAVVLADAWIPGPELAGWEPPFRLARRSGREAAMAVWLADPLFEAARRLPGPRSTLVRMVSANDLAIWTEVIPRASRPGARELANSIHQPTLVIAGELEIPGFRAVADWLATTIPGAGGRPVTVIPGAGHLPPLETPGPFNRVLAGFIQQLPVGGGS